MEETRNGSGRSDAARRRRRALVRQVKRALLRAGAYAWLRRSRPATRPAILRYHAVAGDEARSYAGDGITITPAAFARQVRYLSRRYTMTDMDAIGAWLGGAAALPHDAVAFTFDDGYRDNLEASHLLARHGCRGTFYLTTERLAGRPPLWCVDVRRRVLAADGRRIELDWEGERLRFPADGAGGAEAAIGALNGWIKRRTVAERERFLAAFAAAFPLPAAAGDRPMLDWDEVRSMRDAGMRIGGHTTTHANLVHATDDEAREEIAGCHATLTRELGAPPRHLAYPNGGADRHFDERAKRLVREAGFATAVTSVGGFPGPRSDPYELRRVGIGPSLAELVHELEWRKRRGGDV